MTHTTPEVKEILDEFRNKILDVETAIRLTYNEKDSDAMVAKMLDFITTLTAKHEADVEKARQEERERIREQLKNIPSGEDVKISGIRMNAAGAGGWDALRYSLIQNFDAYLSLTPTKTDKQEDYKE